MVYDCLVLDDNEEGRLVLSEIISLCGHKVVEAPNAEVALKLCRHKMPDYIFVDWMMPEMDGIQFIKQLHAIEGESHAKIIMCTAKSQLDDPSSIRESKIDGYLQKPIHVADIRNIFNQM